MKRALYWIGSGLAILGLVFVALRLKEYSGQIDLGRFGISDWVTLGGLAAVYGLANTLLALAWRNLLEFCGERTGRLWAIRAYGISQLAKYVPGNIFHFAGRQAIGASAGLTAWPLARSTLWELGLISITGAFFALLAAPLLVPLLPVGVAVVLFASAVAAAFAVAVRLFGRNIATALGQQAGFLIISGATFVGVMALVAPPDTIGWNLTFTLCGAYVIAWLAGLLTPGAPAGLGIREFVLLFLLTGIISEPDVLVAVVLGRIVSVLGDTLFFSSAWIVSARVHDD